MNFSRINEWNDFKSRPFLISGPCSAETEEQMQTTCSQLAQTGKVNVLRAGIWKPRTRPNAFEGVGVEALAWLKQAGIDNNLPVATEVANGQHVEACLKAGIDILWIGARTTVNPFSVQEVADALKGVDIPVLVKNPVNPDLQLWIGALERIHQAGITKLGAIHRGFSSFQKTAYRNVPKWEIPIELKATFPEIDIICDPSHIAGNRELLAAIAQKAMDLEMTGLMIESHVDPDEAWSDAKQQVTPSRLNELIDTLTIRSTEASSAETSTELIGFRKIIDEIDESLIQTLVDRMALSEKIGQYKLENNVTILQIKRWEEIKRTRMEQANSEGLNEEFMKSLLQLIHKESIRQQTDVMNKSITIG
ncbi:MAG: bifunctional 3-deoxy-7-phosphoheptulonate synthase/chorismate mutase type II [Flavobacteriales bacterium]|nr:bifunctional 3-deoxy-7-phosphoheptulonate synthase/chorismate mutase type II [Flavobacteriales bacterium]